MKKWFHVFFKNRWGRGQPDDIGAINLGDEKFDPDSDKKPRAGQILWIRGLTRLQTQVTIPISLCLFLCFFLSLYLSLSFSHYLITQQKKKKTNILLYHVIQKTKPDPASGSRWWNHTVLFNIKTFLKDSFFFFLPFFSTERALSFNCLLHSRWTYACIQLLYIN